MPLQVILNKNKAGKVRIDRIADKQYMVVPMVMMTEGVHNGSGGPIYYPADELQKFVDSWNHKPVVVYHPEINGNGVSACDPDILTVQGVGIVMNTKFDTQKRLVSEAWFEVGRLEKVDPRIAEAISNNSMMEVSTGLFLEEEQSTGEWQGETYKAIARNYRPDHLAILPDRIGACSIEDGAGLNRNESNTPTKVFPILNEVSYERIRGQIYSFLNSMYVGTVPDSDYCSRDWYIEDIYNTFFIYSKSGKLYKLGYTVTDDVVSIPNATPVEVERVVYYQEKATGTYIGNSRGVSQVNKAQMIAYLIGNSGGVWTDANKSTLEGFGDQQLGAMVKQLQDAVKFNQQSNPANPPPGFTTTNSTAPAAPISTQQYIAAMPPELQAHWNRMLTNEANQKKAMIDELLAIPVTNGASQPTRELLESKSLDELEGWVKFARGIRPVYNQNGYNPGQTFAGQGAAPPMFVPVNNNTAAGDAAGSKAADDSGLPVLNMMDGYKK